MLTIVLGVVFSFVVDENRRPDGSLDQPGYSNLLESIWEAWTLLADTGIQYYSWAPMERMVAAVTTLFGILFFSVVVGFVVDAVRSQASRCGPPPCCCLGPPLLPSSRPPDGPAEERTRARL